MTMSSGADRLRARAWVEVDLDVIEANARELTSYLAPEQSLMAVIKADAYGHGLLPVAHAVLRGGAAWLGVATTAEGIALRAEGITAPICLLCTAGPGQAKEVVAHQLTPMLGDHAAAAALVAAGGRGRSQVHLDIDTGMGRSGVLPEKAVALWQQCMRGGLAISGLCTHFADADGASDALTSRQWNRFVEARTALVQAGAKLDWIHAMNSAAAVRLSAAGCNLARIGLLLYGLRPDVQPREYDAEERRPSSLSPPSLEARAMRVTSARSSARSAPEFPPVRPALAVSARVGAVRDLPAGHNISYGATCTLARASRVATVLIGYGDGYPRRLSNVGDMLVNGNRAKILGRVCMDQTVIDVTDIPDVREGDIAICIGAGGDQEITAESIARRVDTTEHEITTCLTARLPRVYIGGVQ